MIKDQTEIENGDSVKAWRIEVGRRVALWRKKRGLSQQALADLTSTNRPTISKIELGNTEIRALHLLEIANTLGVDPSALAPPIKSESMPDTEPAILSRLAIQAEKAEFAVSELNRLIKKLI